MAEAQKLSEGVALFDDGECDLITLAEYARDMEKEPHYFTVSKRFNPTYRNRLDEILRANITEFHFDNANAHAWTVFQTDKGAIKLTANNVSLTARSKKTKTVDIDRTRYLVEALPLTYYTQPQDANRFMLARWTGLGEQMKTPREIFTLLDLLGVSEYCPKDSNGSPWFQNRVSRMLVEAGFAVHDVDGKHAQGTGPTNHTLKIIDNTGKNFHGFSPGSDEAGLAKSFQFPLPSGKNVRDVLSKHSGNSNGHLIIFDEAVQKELRELRGPENPDFKDILGVPPFDAPDVVGTLEDTEALIKAVYSREAVTDGDDGNHGEDKGQESHQDNGRPNDYDNRNHQNGHDDEHRHVRHGNDDDNQRGHHDNDQDNDDDNNDHSDHHGDDHDNRHGYHGDNDDHDHGYNGDDHRGHNGDNNDDHHGYHGDDDGNHGDYHGHNRDSHPGHHGDDHGYDHRNDYDHPHNDGHGDHDEHGHGQHGDGSGHWDGDHEHYNEDEGYGGNDHHDKGDYDHDHDHGNHYDGRGNDDYEHGHDEGYESHHGKGNHYDEDDHHGYDGDHGYDGNHGHDEGHEHYDGHGHDDEGHYDYGHGDNDEGHYGHDHDYDDNHGYNDGHNDSRGFEYHIQGRYY